MRIDGHGGHRLDFDQRVRRIQPDLHRRASKLDASQHLAADLVHAGVVRAGPQEHRDLDQILQRSARRFDDVADVLDALPRLRADVAAPNRVALGVAGNDARREYELRVRHLDALHVRAFGLGDLVGLNRFLRHDLSPLTDGP